MQTNTYASILKSKEKAKKQFAVLIDPDNFGTNEIIRLSEKAEVDYILVGGSLLTNGNFSNCIQTIKKQTHIPLIIFPGNNLQIHAAADAIFLLSVISGRNPDMLIGKHVIAAPALKASRLEIIPTGYILVESGTLTSALYMSNTQPIPASKPDIAMCTAIAGEMLGLKLIYMDAGSGALNSISSNMINKVSSAINIPLVVGGGINTVAKAVMAARAGADIIVVGNAIEKDLTLVKDISQAVHEI